MGHRGFRRSVVLSALVCAAASSLGAGAAQAAPQPAEPPSVLFGELYARVETSRVFPDSKTFADAEPLKAPAEILADYRAHRPATDAELKAFVAARFRVPLDANAPPKPAAAGRLALSQHIAALWPELTRPPLQPGPYASALAIPRPYVVPGGRFREVYYWDSYFTLLGLVRDGRRDLAQAMTDDFAAFIDAYGHVPNGSRTYYLSRSQPPVFYLMVAASAEDPDAGFQRYLPSLKREYAWWMRGAEDVKPGVARGHVVALADGSILNRYWDDRAAPRDEAYREDLALAAGSGRPPAEVYRDLRAAAESGWDFSSRWFADGRSLSTIRTTSLVPVDLNSLLFGLEQAIARGCAKAGDAACAAHFHARAERRRRAMSRWLWDAGTGVFHDYDWRTRTASERLSAAMLFPLFTGAASREQGRAVATFVRAHLLEPGGVATTAAHTGQQWDAPNGWAPLQWAAVEGLRAVGEDELARTVAERWLATVSRVYETSGALYEKYDLTLKAPGGGGEYKLQDGFGWTNGVTEALIGLYPDLR